MSILLQYKQYEEHEVVGRGGALVESEGLRVRIRSSRQVGTLGKFLTRSCLWRFGVKLLHSIRRPTVSGALLNSNGLEEAL